MDWMISLPFFYKDGFAIKWPAKVDMSLNKETKPIVLSHWLNRTNINRAISLRV